jgi:hypothetical protein
VKHDRFRVEFLWEKYCKCDEFDFERYEQQLIEQFRPMLRGLVFKLRSAIGWLFPTHDVCDFFVLAELAFVLAVRGLKSEQVVPEHVLGCLRTRCLFQLLKLLRGEFEFSSSVVWGELLRGSELPTSALALIRADKIEDLLSPDQSDGDDDESRDELWLQSPHRDLHPQYALELKEFAQEIWSGLCAGDLRIPERWQQSDELIAFLRECGLQIGKADYRRMLRRNKARRMRAQVKNNNPDKGAKPSAGVGCAGRWRSAVQKCNFPRQHLMDRHDRILMGIVRAFRSAGLDVAPAGAEYGGEQYDPDLFVKPRHEQSGFYLEIKTPQRERVAVDLDEWTYFRALGKVLVLGVWSDGRCAVIDVDADRPLFWGASADDRIPVLAAGQLIELSVPMKLFERGSPQYTSNKPFVVFRPRRVYQALDQALVAVLRKAGIRGG